MDLKILHRDESLQIITNKSFIAEWQSLADSSKEFTLIQEPDLVVSWYQAYQNEYDPVLIEARDKENDLIGILPLAISLDYGSLSHAGDQQAEYNGWIAKEDIAENFLIESLILLKKEYSLTKWNWGWLPPHCNTEWLQSEKLKENGIFVNIEHCELPIYDLNDTARIDKIKKSKSTKSKINRLKRSGDLKIERITDIKRAKAIFGDLKNISNFRNLAVYDNMPFINENSNKENWHLNHLEDSDSVHFTVLWQGDEFLACNFGFCSGDTVIIGLFTYNPVQGAHSPGNVFIIELINFITEEGFKTLDLSPGGDPYKERFSNKHITLSKPVFTFSKTSKLKNDAITFVKNKIKEKYSYRDIVAFKTNFKKKINELKKQSNNAYEVLKLAPIDFSIEDKNSENKIEIASQKFEDLLLYQNKKDHPKQSEIIFSALKNFERGDSLYTLVQNNELVFYCWVSSSTKKHWNDNLNKVISETGDNILFYDTYISEEKVSKSKILNALKILNSEHNKDKKACYMIKPIHVSSDYLQAFGLERT